MLKQSSVKDTICINESNHRGFYVAFKAFYKTPDPNIVLGFNEFRFKVNTIYNISGELEFCKNGFHFCEMPLDVDICYTPAQNIIYGLVEILGDVKHDIIHHKSITNKIRLIKTLSRSQLLEYCKGIFRTHVGDVFHFKNNKLHSNNDIPAIYRVSGEMIWYKDGMIHRNNDKPAHITTSKIMYWYYNGLIHRLNDKPAIIYPDGTKYWYVNGLLHRLNDKPAIVGKDELEQHWYYNGQRHRSNNLPAIILGKKNSIYYWYEYGIRHNIIHNF
jgi:hypothetical protein